MENEELNLDLDNIEQDAEKKVEIKNRYQKLSEKVINTSKERDNALAKAKEEADAKASAEKERDFYKSFSQISAKYPEATNFQSQILERVNKGYDQEEAVLAVLAKEGKLPQTMPEPVRQPITNVEGGSAPTAIEGAKPTRDMSADDKLAELSKLSNQEIISAMREFTI